MTEYFLQNQYFEWLYKLIDDEKLSRRYSYRKLLTYLHNIDFSYSIAMDSNRENDGIDLRYRFGDEYEYPQAMVASILDVKPCSVLEMMCALALRCEEFIMNNPEQKTGPEKWFWIMINNLGLESMNNENYDKSCILIVIHRFLNRDYAKNGQGGLFIINNLHIDLRDVEIWHQMCWFLDDYLNI